MTKFGAKKLNISLIKSTREIPGLIAKLVIIATE